MKEKDKDYYNEIFTTAPQYSLGCDADNSWHHDLYNFVITFFNPNDQILELGCGTGQFAKKLIDSGFNYFAGIDFSIKGVELSRQRCPGKNFICADLRYIDLVDFEYNTILSLETIEHIEDDLQILSKIKEDTKVIISVPSFDDPAHVRFFKSTKDVSDRYSKLFYTTNVHKVGTYFVIEAVK